MNFRLIQILYGLRTSYWFIPVVMVTIAVVLACAVIRIDQSVYQPTGLVSRWIGTIGAAGSRAVFSTVAGSVITVTGVIFSISMVVLSMASNQFGPRLIPTFMRVGRIQFGIGMFVGTFVYCLLMLTFVPAEFTEKQLPVWGVLTGLALGIAAFLVLIMLIHEIAVFIQAPNVIERVARDIDGTFCRIFPDREENGEEPVAESPATGESSGTAVYASESGYLQTADSGELLELAERAGRTISLAIKPGEFVVKGQRIGDVHPAGPLDADFVDGVRRALVIGPGRDMAQDAEFAVDQMVEIAVRALSPGVNDPFTAMGCIDKLGAALASLGRRRIAASHLFDDNGVLRLIRRPDSYRSVIDAAFDQIRQNCASQPAVQIRLVETIGKLARLELPAAMRVALGDHLDLIQESFARDFSHESDRETFLHRCDKARAALQPAGSACR